jgi:hypothetical protein
MCLTLQDRRWQPVQIQFFFGICEVLYVYLLLFLLLLMMVMIVRSSCTEQFCIVVFTLQDGRQCGGRAMC